MLGCVITDVSSPGVSSPGVSSPDVSSLMAQVHTRHSATVCFKAACRGQRRVFLVFHRSVGCYGTHECTDGCVFRVLLCAFVCECRCTETGGWLRRFIGILFRQLQEHRPPMLCCPACMLQQLRTWTSAGDAMAGARQKPQHACWAHQLINTLFTKAQGWIVGCRWLGCLRPS